MKLSKKKELRVLNKQNEHLQDTKQPYGCYDNLFVCKEKPSFWESDKGYLIKVVGISTPIYVAGLGATFIAAATPLLAVGVAGSLITGDWSYIYPFAIAGGIFSIAVNTVSFHSITETLQNVIDSFF